MGKVGSKVSQEGVPNVAKAFLVLKGSFSSCGHT